MTASESGSLLHARAYQREMFEQSMQRNIIVCMATGSGKTQVAVQRIDAELRRNSTQTVWFTAPNVILAQQQHYVLSSQLPQYQMRTLLGHDNVHLWRTQKVWDLALANMNVIVCTPQVLLDGLRNAFVSLETISLLVVDEAHHCHSGSPSAQIMLQHYHRLKAHRPQNIPHVLGLTASIRISKKSASIAELEYNLDAICRAPTLSIDDYAMYVHRAQIVELVYAPTEKPHSKLLNVLQDTVTATNLCDDPYHQTLKNATDLASEQKLAKYEKKKATPAIRELKQLCGNAEDIHKNVGSWASDSFVRSCVFNWHQALMQKSSFDASLPKASPQFVDDRLSRAREVMQENHPLSEACMSDKSQELIRFLASEYREGIAIIVFVERRSTAYALCELLRSAPALSSYRVFPFVGLATSRVSSLIEVADMKVQRQAFADFRRGSQDICVATSVAEEGIDIQAVNLVIRYDDPKQFVSFLQSRGRARQKDSKFVYFRNTNDDKNKYSSWKQFEQELEAEYRAELRVLHERQAADELDDSKGEEYIVQSTGARLVYDNAAQHLQHFCTVVSGGVEPIYVLIGEANVSIKARVVLPDCVPPQWREAVSKRAWYGEKSARKDAAFQAYKALHEAKLVTDNLVPFQPEPVSGIEAKHGLRLHDIEAELAVWHASTDAKLFLHRIMVTCGEEQYSSLMMALPCSLGHTLRFQLSVSASRTLDVEVTPMGACAQEHRNDAERVTRALFEVAFRKGSAFASLDDASSIPLLVTPACGRDYDPGMEHASLREFLTKDESLLNCQPLLLWHGGSPSPYIWYPPHAEHILTRSSRTVSVTKIRKLQIYTSQRNVGENDPSPQSRSFSVDECTTKGLGTIYGPLMLLIPSILHIMSAALRAQHAEQHVLKNIGFSDTEYLVPALLTKSAAGVYNYERLEFLGDTILKARTSLQMFFDLPHAMEGELTVKVKDTVSNLRLEKAFQDVGMAPYVTTQAPVQKHWKLPQLAAFVPLTEPRKLLSKALADVVESVLAAAFLDGLRAGQADQKCTAALRIFLSDIDWRHPSEIVDAITSAMPVSQVGSIMVEPLKRITGYEWNRPTLLLEALSYSAALPGSPSLQRLEFLGDAFLDLIIKSKLFHNSDLGPDRMTSHRHALASHDYLAFCSFSLSDIRLRNNIKDSRNDSINIEQEAQPIYLEHFIQLGNTPLRAQISSARTRYDINKRAIEAQLKQGTFPWTLLRSLSAPKVCSDVIESLIASIYIDSGGSLDACERFVERLGIMDLLHVMVKDDAYQSETPATRLRNACAAEHIDVHICSAASGDDTRHIWKVILRKDGSCKEFVGREASCEDEARSVAAEIALQAVLAGEHKELIPPEEELPATQDSVMTGMRGSEDEPDEDDEDPDDGGILLDDGT
ncbi:Dicer-like protein 2 [Knufia obscura]|uniref:Dicer-like protein 2 n=1 Tax=Knufia obscura TaxID=1635080 RepID=A0ABR0RVH8_9EURO|nr:Dicer-like protein 2 [Knufia obscura]